MSNVLLVGGAGYVGGGVADALSAAGHAVRVYDLLLYEDVYLKPIDFYFGDVRDSAKLRPLLAWADAVVWLAALVGDGACSLNPAMTREINVDSVRWLVENYDRRIIFLSTCSVYGAREGVLTEDSPTNPLSLYAVTKLEAEEILRPTEALVLRLGTLFGLGDTYSRIRMDLVVNTLTVKACLYKQIGVFGGEQYRPLLHVRDVAPPVLANVTCRNSGIYNLHAVNMRIRELGDTLKTHVPDLQIRHTAIRYQDSRNYMVSSDKARSTFDFQPDYCVDDGIREIKSLVERGRIRDISSPRYSNTDFLRPFLSLEDSPLGFEVTPARRIRR
jgi:nucleoside-diphosphate-sugar epimerase